MIQNKKIFLITIAILVILGIGGFFIYQKYFAQGTQPPTANLKTYENVEYGFGFQYPKGWFLSDLTMPDQGNADLWIHVQNNTEEFPKASNNWKTASFFDVKITKISENASISSYIQEPKNIRKINIGDLQYDTGIPFDDPLDLTSSSNIVSSIYVINQGKLYVISYSAANVDEYKNNKKIFIDTLSTFKFIISQATSWKTYKNDEYGFEIKYPGNWKAGISPLFPNVILFCPPELSSTDPGVICALKQNVGHADTQAPIIFSLIQNKLQLTNEEGQYGSVFKEMQNSFKSFKQDSELKTYKNFGIEFQYPKTLGEPQEIVVARATNILFDNNKLSVIIASQYNNETGKFDTFEQVVDRYTNGNNNKFVHTMKDFFTKSGVNGKAGSYRDKTASAETKAGFEAYFPIDSESFVIFSADYNYLLEETFNQIISTLKLTK